MRRWLLVVLAVVGVLGWSTGTVAAQAPSDLSASVAAKNPTEPVLRLKNISNHACQIATTAQGTVAITQVIQNGKTLQPLPIDGASDEDIGYLLQSQLQTLQPGQSADINLLVYKQSAGYVLRATTWSSGAGSFEAAYPISATGSLQLDASYSLPITPAKGAPACGAVFATISSGRAPWLKILLSLLAVVILLLLIALIWWLLKRPRHGKKAIVAAAIALGLLFAWHHAPLASADVVVPPELQSVYDGCIATFNANSDITGPILRILNDPANHFEIVHTHSAGSDMTGRPGPGGGGIFTIYWNPDDHHRYAGTGGYPDACSTLYHELYHALDQLNGTFSRDDCAGSGIETKEVMATRAQNVLRVRLGLPARSHYGDRPLPSGDCRARARPTSCTGDRCSETNGDPHLRTFDGLRYDFQAAGEFVAARNKTGDFEVQVRQQPWTNSRTVAINTAVAFRVGTDKVEVGAGDPMPLRVNGKIQTLASAKLPGGGQLQMDTEQNTLAITWANGSIAYVRPVSTYGLALGVQAADDLSGKLEGLFGDADGNPKNDVRVHSGAGIQPTFEQLYPKFADSWRITDQTSLFTYDSGKHTGSYTNKHFPDKPADPKTLPGYAAALVYCKNAGLTDPTILSNCALDMATTGRPEFARSAVASQAFTTGTSANATTWQFDIKQPGDSATATFDAQAGQKVFVQIPQTTLPSQCGTLRLLGPDQQEVANGCIINGQGSIDGTVLPTTGTYTVSLTPGGPTGTATVRLLRITDKQGTITPDGSPMTANIDQPGVVARYTFSGTAGQHAYVDVPSSTLDSQCGIILLEDAGGHVITNGCVINHAGYIDTAVLPANGQYMIVVDPNDATTGTAQLRLVLPTAETKPIVLDGSTVTVALKKPGSTATLTFNATAGQQVYVDLPSSELPSQCGLLVLHAPDGSALASGCVINHKGNLSDAAVTLPATGAYAITLDPGAADTGTTTVKLRSR